MVITRTDYLNGKNTHEEYYGQFVTSHMIDFVSEHIGRERILASKEPYLNDIPLNEWDKLAHDIQASLDMELWAKSGNGDWSLSAAVSIAKAAARHLSQK